MSELKTLYEHIPHKHQPVNVAVLHKREQHDAGFNTQVAVGMTKVLSSMITFWIVGLFITGWILLSYTPAGFDKMPWPLLLTVLNIPQISMMIGLGVGQGVLGRHQELQSNEQYQYTMSTYHDSEQMMLHLTEQDAELLKQTGELLKQTPMLETIMTKLDAHETLLKSLSTRATRSRTHD